MGNFPARGIAAPLRRIAVVILNPVNSFFMNLRHGLEQIIFYKTGRLGDAAIRHDDLLFCLMFLVSCARIVDGGVWKAEAGAIPQLTR